MSAFIKIAAPKLTAERLRRALGAAREIYVSGCSSEISALPGLLNEAQIRGTVTSIVSPLVNTNSYASADLGRRCRTFFLNKALRQGLGEGLVDFCPWTYSEIHRWITQSHRFDATIVMVSPPDDDGNHRLGTQVDFLPTMLDRAGVLIGVMNPNLPRTLGPVRIAPDRFSALFTIDAPLLGVEPSGPATDAISAAIAAEVSNWVDDSSTLQFGMGRIPQAVVSELKARRGLRIHSGMIDDGVLGLEQAGALDPDMPIVTGVAIGSTELYDHIDLNPRFSFRPVSQTHLQSAVAANRRFIAINGALQVDLLGQVNSEAGGGRFIASPGGLPDFMRGARGSEGGLSIIAVRAKPGRVGRGGIVARLDAPSIVSLPRCDVDIVVTENGSADLRNTSIDQRAQALISIADPAEQATLDQEWQAIRRAGIQ